MKIKRLIILTMFLSCRYRPPVPGNPQPATGNISNLTLLSSDTALEFKNGNYYYRQRLFSGHSMDRYVNDSIHHQFSWLDGKQEGWQFVYYPDGSLSEKRYYHLGEKDSVHTGFWENGKMRFEYHFHNGLYNGDYKEWYASGQPYKNIYYNAGLDEYGKGWRENGKIYMSYITRHGRRFGLINANLCYTLKNEKGEFVKSIGKGQ